MTDQQKAVINALVQAYHMYTELEYVYYTTDHPLCAVKQLPEVFHGVLSSETLDMIIGDGDE